MHRRTSPAWRARQSLAGQAHRCELWAVTPEGTIAMSAQAEFA